MRFIWRNRENRPFSCLPVAAAKANGAILRAKYSDREPVVRMPGKCVVVVEETKEIERSNRELNPRHVDPAGFSRFQTGTLHSLHSRASPERAIRVV